MVYKIIKIHEHDWDYTRYNRYLGLIGTFEGFRSDREYQTGYISTLITRDIFFTGVKIKRLNFITQIIFYIKKIFKIHDKMSVL